MSTIKLSDQLGAMAIIDKLHHQHMLMMEHLDQASLRKKIAEKIKQYYQDNGLAVDDKIIEDGIKLWYDKRLRLELPRTSWLQRQLARGYIARGRWGPKLAAALGCIVLAPIILLSVNHFRFSSLQSSIAEYSQQLVDKNKKLTELKLDYAGLNYANVSYAGPAVAKLRFQIDRLLSDIDSDKTQSNYTEIKVASLEQGKAQQELLARKNRSQEASLERLAAYLAELRELIEQDSYLSQLANNSRFSSALTQYAVLRRTFDAAVSDIERGERSGSLPKLESLYQQTQAAEELKVSLGRTIDRFYDMNLPVSDMKIVLAVHDAMLAELEQLNMHGARKHAQRLDYYLNLAKTPLKLNIVDRVGEKSGVERTYDGSGGKSWYLVVEATTAAGNVFPLQVENSETGETKIIRTFAVRVSQQEYNKVRHDKAQDGHIDKPLVGNKSVGRLTFNYSRPVVDGVITEW